VERWARRINADRFMGSMVQASRVRPIIACRYVEQGAFAWQFPRQAEWSNSPGLALTSIRGRPAGLRCDRGKWKQ
jgi:hypothetical protein